MKLDPVDQKALKGSHKDAKDKDINNDGKVNSSDEYLHKRRQAVSKALGKLKEEALGEAKKPNQYIGVHDNDSLIKHFDHGTAIDARHTSPNMMFRKGKDGKDYVLTKVNNRGHYEATPSSVKKEEAEQIDEVSASTLGSYIRKASKDADASMQKRNDALDNDDGETARKMGRIARKRDKGTSMAMDKLKGTRYAKVHATEEADLDEAKKPKPGHNAMVMAKNISKVLSAVKKEETDDSSTVAKHTKPLRMKLSQFRHEE